MKNRLRSMYSLDHFQSLAGHGRVVNLSLRVKAYQPLLITVAIKRHDEIVAQATRLVSIFFSVKRNG